MATSTDSGWPDGNPETDGASEAGPADGDGAEGAEQPAPTTRHIVRINPDRDRTHLRPRCETTTPPVGNATY